MAKQKEISLQYIGSIFIKYIIPFIVFLSGVFTAGFYVGEWRSGIDYKTMLNEKDQAYNVQITNLKLDYNNRILEMQNKLQIIEMSKNINYEKK